MKLFVLFNNLVQAHQVTGRLHMRSDIYLVHDINKMMVQTYVIVLIPQAMVPEELALNSMPSQEPLVPLRVKVT